MTSVHGITVTGGSFPASIWRLFMSRALSGTPRVSWPYPKNPAIWNPTFTGEFAFVGAPPEPKKPKKDKKTTTGETPTEPPPTTTEPPPTTTGR